MGIPKLLSLNVGLPREVYMGKKLVRTSIYKSPVDGTVRVSKTNLEGDYQSDPTVHGGRDKAVYVYPYEHYAYWKKELPKLDLPYGAFGENFTTRGLDEENVHIGDRFRIGTAEFVVTQPRLPCYKLGIRLGNPDIIKMFQESGKTGFYFSVYRVGYVAAGDIIERSSRDKQGISVSDILHLREAEKPDRDLLRRASFISALPDGWRKKFRDMAG